MLIINLLEDCLMNKTLMSVTIRNFKKKFQFPLANHATFVLFTEEQLALNNFFR